MKYLDLAPLNRLGSFLDHVDVGDYVVYGNLEAYSCKLAGLDKKLSRSLEQDVQEGGSPIELSMSPVGPLTDSSSRKTLIYLILTLNHIYPDYDFSQLRAQHFRKEASLATAEEAIDTRLIDVSKVWEKTPQSSDKPFLESLWSAVDEAVDLKDCELYSYQSDLDTDPFGEKATVWSFNFFFYNKKMKRMVYLSCRAASKLSAEKEVTEESSKWVYNSDDEDDGATDYGMANEMDV